MTKNQSLTTILAIDVGSSSVRTLLFQHDDTGLHLIPDAIVQREYQFDYNSTVNPIFLRDLLESCIDEMLQHEVAHTIQAVGMATFVGNWLATHGNEVVDETLYTYADTRSSDAVAKLQDRLDTDSLHQRTGIILNAAYFPPQYLHFKNKGKTSEQMMNFGAYCYSQWMRETTKTSYSVASWSGMLNREQLVWDGRLLDTLGLSAEQMPELADYQYKSMLNDHYAKRWQALADVPFFLAVGDGAAAQVGSGAIERNTATLTVGTTAAIRKVSTEQLPTVPDGSWSYFIDEVHHLMGGALSEGGNIFAWANNTLNLESVDIEAELKQRKPASHGLTVLPMLNGERSPHWRGHATGTIHGLQLSSTPMDMLHALLESVALRLAIIAEQLNLAEDVTLMAAGGALHHSPAWTQIIADALGREVHLIADAEVTALGVAQLAICALNNKPVSGASPKIERIYNPNPQYRAIYSELRAKQADLYRITDSL